MNRGLIRTVLVLTITAIALAGSHGVAAGATHDHSLYDVRTHWARPEIVGLAEAGVVAGFPDGSFRPEREISRAALLKMLVGVSGLPLTGQGGRGSREFTDVSGHWSDEQGYLGAALSSGILDPADYPRRSFEPDRPMIKREIAVMAGRVAGLKSDFRGAGPDPRTAGPSYDPRAPGLGSDPGALATRAQAVVVAARLMDRLTRSDPADLVEIVPDDGVAEQTAKEVRAMFADAYRIVSADLDAYPANPAAKIKLNLHSTTESYRRAMVSEGSSPEEVARYSEHSGGYASETSIRLNLARAHDRSELQATLTHELTHVLMNLLGIGEKIPSWANEGLSWHEGARGEAAALGGSPLLAQRTYMIMRDEVLQAYFSGELRPLIVANEDPGTAWVKYNPQAQGLLAVDFLISRCGTGSFRRYLDELRVRDPADAFALAFGEDFSRFEEKFNRFLREEAAAGGAEPKLSIRVPELKLSIRVPPGAVGSLLIQPAGSKVGIGLTIPGALLEGAPTGRDLTFILKAGGSILSPEGLAPSPSYWSAALPQVTVIWTPGRRSGDPPASRTGAREVSYEGFIIKLSYGRYYLDGVFIHHSDGHTESVPGTRMSSGIEIVGLHQAR